MVLEAAAAKTKQYTEADLADLKVAFVHYWLVTWRGGEKVLNSLLKLFPNSDIYTLFFDKETCGHHLNGHNIYSSVLDVQPLRKHYQKLFPLYPLGIKSLQLKHKYDLIISSESGPAKGISNPGKIPHLCYIHTPMRYCWGYTDSYLQTLPKWSRSFAEIQFERLRKWDTKTIDSVDLYVANSDNVARRVKDFYKRSARTCYPPIDLELFDSALERKHGEYFLSFGALTPYKNVELLVKTFNRTGERLIVIGDGSERKKLENAANSNIEFLGSLPTPAILDCLKNARALLFPGEEDFGMIPLEVMAQGIPVIAYQKGGALETVVENELDPASSSGLFFREPTVPGLIEAIERFKSIENKFDPVFIRKHARSFGEDHFQEKMKKNVLDLLNNKY